MSTAQEETYLVLSTRDWNRGVFDELLAAAPGRWLYGDDPGKLTLAEMESLRPRYLFFFHWSTKVDPAITSQFECVCFHMTDVPYGRGGSPLQNLIARGHRDTRLSAMRMTGELDAGPVYLKRELSLEGTAEEIYLRAGRLSAEMALEIATKRIEPQPQSGDPVLFQRRRPNQSEISESPNLRSMYDFIRMLDADGYPHAFLVHRGFRYEFRRATLRDGRIVADVVITECKDGNS